MLGATGCKNYIYCILTERTVYKDFLALIPALSVEFVR